MNDYCVIYFHAGAEVAKASRVINLTRAHELIRKNAISGVNVTLALVGLTKAEADEEVLRIRHLRNPPKVRPFKVKTRKEGDFEIKSVRVRLADHL